MDLTGKVAFITGAGSGMGHAAAVKLAAAGARIGVLDLEEAEVKATIEEIEGAGGEAVALTADVSNPEQVKAAADKLAEAFGTIDIVFANAGVNGVWAPLEELEPQEWDETLAINLRGTFLTLKYSLPYLKTKGGSVVITSSVQGTRIFSNAGATAYGASKAAQVAFAKISAIELAKHRIRVNVICPGAISTNIGENTEARHLERVQEPVVFPEGAIPLTDGEPGSAEQVADLVAFLASDAASHISGTEVWIDGAQSLLQG